MKIALAQLNFAIGDLKGNTRRIQEYAARAKKQGCRLIVFPEMAITGYPPRDLLTRSGFVTAAMKAVETLRKSIQGIAVIIGGVESLPNGLGLEKALYNTAFLLDGQGGIISRHKRVLADYDLLDEARYFASGQSTDCFDLDGLSIGVTIGEELGGPDSLMQTQAGAGADLLVNIGSFPYYFGQEAAIQGLLSQRARKTAKPVIWVNQVGANDESIFAGQSLAVDAEGNICARTQPFREELLIVEMEDRKLRGEMPPVTTNSIAMLHDALILGIRDYMRKSGFTDVVLGLSGGLDSAVVACLAVAALGPEYVHGISLPSPYSPTSSMIDARALAKNLGCDMQIIPISDALASVKGTMADCFIDINLDVVEENIQARLRGLFWMALSNKYGWLLLNASNKSELAVGYTTLYGDMCGSLAVLSDVYKSDVYRLANWINREQAIIPASTMTKPPSAELRPDQKDTDTLPPYSILDGILRLFIEEGKTRHEVREAGYPIETVDRVLRLLLRTEYKRNQAAPGLRVSKRGFGSGWRMPLVSSYQWLWDDDGSEASSVEIAEEALT
ncbi:MAG: NAD+ synthase [Firmicutes bacterium]|nr:NAD+ synthase [Bacillota bacterium]